MRMLLLLACAIALGGCAIDDAAASHGKRATSPGPTMQFDYDRLDARDAAAHLHEQGSGDRRLRRRRRRVWLQLDAGARERRGTPADAAHARPTARPPARCWPRRWRCRACFPRPRTRRPRPTRACSSCSTSSYRDWQPGQAPDEGRGAGVLRAVSGVRYAGGRRRRWSTTRCRARRRCTSTCCRARRSATTAPPATSRSPSTSAATRSASAASSRRSRISCRAAASVDVQIFSDDRNRTWTLQFGGNSGPDQSDQRRRRRRQAQHAGVHGRRHAGAVANAIIQSNLTYYTGHGYYSDPYKPLDTRPDASQRRRVAHALQPVFRRVRRDAEARLPAAVRFVRQHVEHVRGVVGAGAAVGLHGDAGAALLHAERRRLLHESAVPEGLRRGPGLQRRHAAGGVRRVDRRRHVGKTFENGWSVDVPRRLLPPETRLALSAAAAAPASSRSPRAGWKSDVTKTF